MSWWSIEPSDPQTGHVMLGGAVMANGEPEPLIIGVLIDQDNARRVPT
jgi:hypothetical protein